MKKPTAGAKIVAFLGVLVLGLLAEGCTDSKAINAAFSQTRVSWFLFDAERSDGLRPLPGFEQGQKVVWVPRDKGLFATDLAPAPGKAGAVAVAALGVVLLDDSDGTLTASRPTAAFPIGSYRTGPLFTWNQKLFLTLYQEAPADLTPATLAWWSPGQERLALYPIPSQIQDPTRQAIDVRPPAAGSDVITFDWKYHSGSEWAFEATSLNLANGAEGFDVIEPQAPSPWDESFDGVRARLAERLGAGVPSTPIRGPDTRALFTETGWVSVGKDGDTRARLYRLPDLGVAGRYTRALALHRGFVFTWETGYRGYSGAAGLVHVPFAVLAP